MAADDLAESRLKLRSEDDPRDHACADEIVEELEKFRDVAWLEVPEGLHKRLPDRLVHADAPSVVPPSLEHFDIAIHGEDGARNGPETCAASLKPNGYYILRHLRAVRLSSRL